MYPQLKCLYTYLICFVFLCANPNNNQAQNLSLKPTQFSFDTYTYGMWEFNDGLTGQSLNELRFRAQMLTKSGLGVLIENKSRFYQDKSTENDFSQYYLQYAKSLSHKGWFPLFKFPSQVLLKAGKIAWYPTFRDIRLISENLGLFRDPYSFYGISADIRMPLLKDRSLVARVSGYSNDFKDNKQDAEIRNAYLGYKKNLYKNFGFAIQAGKMQGSIHLINFAYLFYRPKIEKIQLGFKVGKLLSLDQIPYGFEARIEREFKFIALGFYYQRRIDQKSYYDKISNNSQIFGFTWRFIGPKFLKKIIDTYQLVYDSNTETLRFSIPILLSNFNLK
jgi:hypothetical protein